MVTSGTWFGWHQQPLQVKRTVGLTTGWMGRGRKLQAVRRNERCTGAGVRNGAIMSSIEYIYYRGVMLPPLAHTEESLEYARNFSVEDTDVFAVTYPKSGIK